MRVIGKVALLVGAAFPGLALAQPQGTMSIASDEGGVEEIVVTAQKRSENLQDVPIAISAYSSDALEQRGATGLATLLQTPPPGVVMQPNSGSQSLLIIDVRGVSNPDPGQGTTEMGTAVYIDDVYLGRGQGLGAELADPERIEILRGPQGTLFGRNAEGGAIRIVTKKPTGTFGGDAKVTFGNYGQQRYEAHLNLPEIAGFSIKLDYLNSSHDGWTKNGPRQARIDEQRDFGEYAAEGYRGSVRWRPIDSITIDYAYEHSLVKETRDYYVLAQPPFGFQPNGPLTPLVTLQTARPRDSIHKRTDQSWIPLYNPYAPTETSGHTLQAEFQLSDQLTLRSISAYRDTTAKVESPQSGGALTVTRQGATGIPIENLVPAFGTTSLGLPAGTRAYAIGNGLAGGRLDQSQKSQEFQLIGSSEELQWVVGAYYFSEKVKDVRQALPSIVFTDPGLTTAIGTNPFTIGSASAGRSSQQAKSTSYAGFAQATWSPGFAGNRLHLTAGIRYTDDKKTFLRTEVGGAPVNVVGKPFHARRWDPAFTIAYDVTDNVNVYARYAQAYRAGGVSVRSPSFRPFGAEVNKSYEFGLKSDLLDRRLRVNIAAFENRISNRQLAVQLDPTANPSITDTLNAPGVSRIRGVEIELVAAPSNNLQVGLNYGYLNGKAPPSYKTLDPGATINITNLPKHSLTATLDYALPEWSFGQLAFHIDYSMASKTPGTTRVLAGAFAWELERNVANARATLQHLKFGPAEFRASLFGKNIFNTAYPVFAAPGAVAILSSPCMYGIEIATSF